MLLEHDGLECLKSPDPAVLGAAAACTRKSTIWVRPGFGPVFVRPVGAVEAAPGRRHQILVLPLDSTTIEVADPRHLTTAPYPF